jgi:hypothetical protein
VRSSASKVLCKTTESSAPREAWETLGVGRTNFTDNYVYREGTDATVPGTDVPRLRPVPLGPRAVGFFNDELQSLIEALRRFRKGAAS